MLVGGGVDQLPGHPNLVALSAHASLEDVRDPELRGDLANGLLRVAVLHDRGPRDDTELMDQGKVGQDVLLDAVREEPVVLLLAHVVKGKDSYRLVGRL